MLRRCTWLAAGLVAWPAQAGTPPPQPPLDPEFLEFLAATAEEDESFMDFLESSAADRELRRVAAARDRLAKDGKDEK